MVGGDEMVHVWFCTLLDAEVNAILEVPGRGVTGQVSPILGPLKDASLPEGLWHRREPHGQEEVLGLAKDELWSPALLYHGVSDVQGWLLWVGGEDACNLGPWRAPWVAQQVGWEWALGIDNVFTISE